MKRRSINKSAVTLALLFTTVVAVSIWGGSHPNSLQHGKLSAPATSLDPNQKVFISVGGQSIDNNHPLGGEGLILQQPTTRAQFAADFL